MEKKKRFTRRCAVPSALASPGGPWTWHRAQVHHETESRKACLMTHTWNEIQRLWAHCLATVGRSPMKAWLTASPWRSQPCRPSSGLSRRLRPPFGVLSSHPRPRGFFSPFGGLFFGSFGQFTVSERPLGAVSSGCCTGQSRNVQCAFPAHLPLAQCCRQRSGRRYPHCLGFPVKRRKINTHKAIRDLCRLLINKYIFTNRCLKNRSL